MKKYLFATSILAASVAAPAMSTSLSDDLNWALRYEVEADDFDSYAAERYAALAVFEDKQMRDSEDAQTFAVKGRTAAGGELVTPVTPSDFEIEAGDSLDELQNAYDSLIFAHDNGARDASPRLLAIAQVAYDCWVEQVEEGYQDDDIAACRGVFYDYMKATLRSIDTEEQDIAVMVPAELQASALSVVYFELDSAELTDEAEKAINNVVRTAKSFDIDELRIIGHTDRSGSAEYNEELSAERAQAVRKALMDQGISTVNIEEIDIAAMGESSPAVETGDGVVEPLNRRVMISFAGTAMM